MDRRRLLQFCTVQTGGFWLSSYLAARPAGAASRRLRARACILLFMEGGPSHLDLWDMKPEAPAEVRGPFQSIPTTVPGVQVCEHLPQMARRMHRVAQIRSMTHEEMVHPQAVYQALTGFPKVSTAGSGERRDFPNLATAFGAVDPTPAVLPKVISLPEIMTLDRGFVLPGQDAGFLGLRHDPFRIEVTAGQEVHAPDLTPPPGTAERLARRTALLERLGTKEDGEGLAPLQRQALAMLADPQLSSAFDLEQEPATLRDRYGRHRQGQSTLLARRLVEAGARFVTVYWGREKQDWADGVKDRVANNPWDTHRNHFPLMKDELTPRADQAFAALLDDLETRGLLEETLVLWMGEFGRAPRISEWASREHWPYAYTVLLAGAGVTGGAVYGKTDSWGGEVTEHPVRPADITATVLHSLGVDPQSTLRDAQGRPWVLSEGVPVTAIFH